MRWRDREGWAGDMGGIERGKESRLVTERRDNEWRAGRGSMVLEESRGRGLREENFKLTTQ